MGLRNACKGNCKKFKVKKPPIGARYAVGQARCQICDVWLNYDGAHLKDGSAAKKNSLGWLCNCCNRRLRQMPKNKKCKEKFRDTYTRKSYSDGSNVDPTFQQNLLQDQLSHLISKALNHVKSHRDGVYLSDLQKSLGLSQVDMSKIVPRLERIDVISLEKIKYAGEFLDSLLMYHETENEMSESNNVNDESKHQSSESITTQKDFQNDVISEELISLAQQALFEYSKNKRMIDKSLQQSLTKEFFDVKSIKQIAKNHSEISEKVIRKHIRVPLRFPQRLRELNEDGIHPEPELSSHIALFATDHYNWDGEKDIEDKVINMALSLAKEIIALNKSSHPTPNKMHLQENNMGRDTISAPISIWIAVATLHIQYGMDVDFSAKQIIEKIDQQKLCNASYNTLRSNISAHCVANVPTQSSTYHRKIYRVGLGRYRLYKRGDPYHPTRENCKIVPYPIELPYKYTNLRKWYDEEYCQH